MRRRFNIQRPLVSLNQENEASKVSSLIEQLKNGRASSVDLEVEESVALVSDAGTPIISDPGSILVKTCLLHRLHTTVFVIVDIPVTPIPGANAAISALICSGFYTTPYVFYGFIKRSGKERESL